MLEYGQIFQSPFHKIGNLEIWNIIRAYNCKYFFWIGIYFTEFRNVFYMKDIYVLHCTLMFNYEIYKQILWRVR